MRRRAASQRAEPPTQQRRGKDSQVPSEPGGRADRPPCLLPDEPVDQHNRQKMLEVMVSPAITCKPRRGRSGPGGAGLCRGPRGRSPGLPLALRACPVSAQRRPMSAVCFSAWASSSPSTSSHWSLPAGRAAGECPGTLSPPGAEPMGAVPSPKPAHGRFPRQAAEEEGAPGSHGLAQPGHRLGAGGSSRQQQRAAELPGGFTVILPSRARGKALGSAGVPHCPPGPHLSPVSLGTKGGPGCPGARASLLWGWQGCAGAWASHQVCLSLSTAFRGLPASLLGRCQPLLCPRLRASSRASAGARGAALCQTALRCPACPGRLPAANGDPPVLQGMPAASPTPSWAVLPTTATVTAPSVSAARLPSPPLPACSGAAVPTPSARPCRQRFLQQRRGRHRQHGLGRSLLWLRG